MRDVFGPTGKLRVGVFPGSPLSMALDHATGEMHGLGVDLGKEICKTDRRPIRAGQLSANCRSHRSHEGGRRRFHDQQRHAGTRGSRRVQPDADFARTPDISCPPPPRSRRFQTSASPAFGSASPGEAHRKPPFRNSCPMRPSCRPKRQRAPSKCSSAGNSNLFATNKPTLYEMVRPDGGVPRIG